MKRIILSAVISCMLLESCTHEQTYKATVVNTGVSVIVVDQEDDGQIVHSYTYGDTVLINSINHKIGMGTTKVVIQNRL